MIVENLKLYALAYYCLRPDGTGRVEVGFGRAASATEAEQMGLLSFRTKYPMFHNHVCVAGEISPNDIPISYYRTRS